MSKFIAILLLLCASVVNAQVVPVNRGGTGATTADSAVAHLLPPQTGQSGKVLGTNGATVSWVAQTGGGSSGGGGPQSFYESAGNTGGLTPITITQNGGTLPFTILPSGKITRFAAYSSGGVQMGNTDTFFIFIDSVATAMTVVLNGGDTLAIDTAHVLMLNGKQKVQIYETPGSNGDAIDLRTDFQSNPTDSTVQLIKPIINITGTLNAPIVYDLALVGIQLPASPSGAITVADGAAVAQLDGSHDFTGAGDVTFLNLGSTAHGCTPTLGAGVTSVSFPVTKIFGPNAQGGTPQCFEPTFTTDCINLNISQAQYWMGDVVINGTGCSSIDMTESLFVGGGLSFGISGQPNPNLVAVTANKLKTVVGAITLSDGLASASFAALETCSGYTSNSASNVLTDLRYISAQLELTGLVGVQSLPALTHVDGPVAISSSPSATGYSAPAAITYGSGIDLHTGNGSIASVTLGTIGTLKSIGGDVNISGQACPSSVVNQILALIASLDGTNGTTLYTGHTVDLSGGSMGAPTGQGITDAAKIVGQGNTVNTN